MKKNIIYLQYTNPAGYPPLEHSSKIFVQNGWKVIFVGCGASGEADSFEFPQNEQIQVFKWRFPKPGWRQKLHFMVWTLWAIWITFRSRSYLIYASEPLACPAAWFASFLPRRKIIYHEHDSPSVSGSTRFMYKLLRYRKSVCDRALVAILPNGERARLFREVVNPRCPVHVVWNCPERREIREIPKPPSEKFILFYHGSLTEIRLPLTILDALTFLPPSTELHFAGYTTRGAPSFIEDYLAAARARGLNDRVHYLGAPKLRSELLDLCAQADLGLAFMPISSKDLNMVAMAGASNKPFDYLACGLNILVSDLPDWNELFVDKGLALSCNPIDVSKLVNTIKWHLENSGQCNIFRKRALEILRNLWNYENQFKKSYLLISGPLCQAYE